MVCSNFLKFTHSTVNAYAENTYTPYAMGEFCEEYPKMYTKSTMVIVENINTNLSGGVSSLNILDLKSSGFMVVVVGQLIGEL